METIKIARIGGEFKNDEKKEVSIPKRVIDKYSLINH